MLLLRSVREVDLVARYGGEEFVIVLPKSKKGDAVVLAERVRALVGQHQFPHRDVQPAGRITVSIGVAAYPEDGGDAGEVIVAADKGLYKAKHEGRDRVVGAGGVSRRDDEHDMDLVVEEDGQMREAAMAATDLPSASTMATLRFRTVHEDGFEDDGDGETLEHPATLGGEDSEPPQPDIIVQVLDPDDGFGEGSGGDATPVRDRTTGEFE
jgi:hypothetical protein